MVVITTLPVALAPITLRALQPVVAYAVLMLWLSLAIGLMYSVTGDKEPSKRTALKLLFISREYPPETGGGGIGSYLKAIGPALAARGHAVHILSCVPGQQARTYLDHGVHIHRVDQLAIRGLNRLSRTLTAPLTFARIRTGLSVLVHYKRLDVDFDVVEYPDWGGEGWAFSLLHPKPAVAQLHTPLPLVSRYHIVRNPRDRAWASRLEYLAVHRADLVTSPTSTHLKSFHEIGWLRNHDIITIPHPVDWYRWSHTLPVQKSPPTVLYLGRLARVKAPEVLVQAMGIIQKRVPSAKVLFVGRSSGERDGLPYREWVMLQANKINHCEFVGQVSRDELCGFLSVSRVLAVPSHHEGYSMAAAESMAAGRPVVVTANTGIAELVREADAGRVVPPGDPEALAAALLPFLADPAYAMIVGEKARAVAQTELDPERIAVKREAVYRQAITTFNNRRFHL